MLFQWRSLVGVLSGPGAARKSAMYTADRNLEAYLVERLTDAQIAFTPVELKRQISKDIEKRRERRFQVKETASLFLFNSLHPQEILIQLFDVSRRGLGISTTKALGVGAEVQVHLQDMIVVGTLRYCAPVGDKFYSGILIECILRRTDKGIQGAHVSDDEADARHMAGCARAAR
jgi:hypothetical protein